MARRDVGHHQDLPDVFGFLGDRRFEPVGKAVALQDGLEHGHNVFEHRVLAAELFVGGALHHRRLLQLDAAEGGLERETGPLPADCLGGAVHPVQLVLVHGIQALRIGNDVGNRLGGPGKLQLGRLCAAEVPGRQLLRRDQGTFGHVALTKYLPCGPHSRSSPRRRLHCRHKAAPQNSANRLTFLVSFTSFSHLAVR